MSKWMFECLQEYTVERVQLGEGLSSSLCPHFRDGAASALSGHTLSLAACQSWKAFPGAQHIPAFPGGSEWAGGISQRKGAALHTRILPLCP